MSVVGRHFHGVDGDHAHPRVLEVARDQLRQIALDLVGHLKTAVGLGGLAGHVNKGLERTRHFLDLEEFELVAFFDVVVVLELDTALEAFLDFSRIIFKALQRINC